MVVAAAASVNGFQDSFVRLEEDVLFPGSLVELDDEFLDSSSSSSPSSF